MHGQKRRNSPATRDIGLRFRNYLQVRAVTGQYEYLL